ncbi:MAG TPA: FAD:protein FMN transferase [Bacteroidetes bacterium]|nr:FAD:protein FMN transferase [Bacteroidota bacterium]
MNRVFLLLALFFSACTPQKKTEPVKLLGAAQGTYYSIIYYDEARRNFQPEIDSLLQAFDRSLSLWIPSSILSRVNNNDTSVVPDKSFEDNFNLSMQVAANTNGAFDVTVGPLVRAWGFGFDEKKHVDSHIIDSLLQFTGYRKVKIQNGIIVKDDPRVSLDFNAIAQGYSVDLVGDFLERHGIENYLVDIGGEVKAKGQKPDGSLWKVGIEKPAKHQDDLRSLKAVIALKNKSVATSGSYRKFYIENGIRYSHTIDPKTGRPVQHSLLSVSVLADSTAVADAYATAFMVMGFEKSKQFVEQDSALEAFFIYARPDSTNQIYITKGFKTIITEELK